MENHYYLNLAQEVINGYLVKEDEIKTLAETPASEMLYLILGAWKIRHHFFGNYVHLCTIINAKSGKCPEDCAFCAQSSHHQTEAPIYEFVGRDGILEAIKKVGEKCHRFSVVTSGRRLGKKDLKELCQTLTLGNKKGLSYCASLGSLTKDDLRALKESGLSRYHHNLETAPSFFPNICTTHNIEERVQTIRWAKEVGLEVCSGGIFGMGESIHHIAELALFLRELDVDAVPINFFTPIKGTKLGDKPGPDALHCLRIVAALRFALPNKELIICGGREYNLKDLHPFVLMAGASGIMTGNYLTTQGRSYQEDIEMIEFLGFAPRPKF